MKKKILIIIAVFLLIGAAIAYFFLKNRKNNEIVLYGNVEIRQSDLSFRVSGKLEKLYAEEGDTVKEGDLLAELDSTPYKTALKSAKAQVRERRAQKLEKAANYNFNKPLCADSTISKEECSNLKYTADYASGAYDSSVAKLEQSIIDLDDTKLYAPYNGTILSRIREKGAIVNTNDIIYTISMIEPVWIRAYIDEKDLGRVKLGQKALVYTDSNPKDPYTAQIGFVSPVAEFTPKTVETTNLRTELVYRVRIIVKNPDPYLKQGMPTTIRLLDE